MIKSKYIKPLKQKQLKSTCCFRYWCITTGSAKGAIPKVRPFPLARCCNREGPAADRAPETVNQRPPALPSTPGNHLNPPQKKLENIRNMRKHDMFMERICEKSSNITEHLLLSNDFPRLDAAGPSCRGRQARLATVPIKIGLKQPAKNGQFMFF